MNKQATTAGCTYVLLRSSPLVSTFRQMFDEVSMIEEQELNYSKTGSCEIPARRAGWHVTIESQFYT